nr:MAG TPA: IrrE protein [Caudoviricetes sp.]
MNIISLLKREITQQELLNYYNACITLIDLPEGINGFIFSYENIYNIFVNKELSYYKRKKTILHELAHIELSQLKQVNKDLFAFYIDTYEDEADKYIKFIIETIKEEENVF